MLPLEGFDTRPLVTQERDDGRTPGTQCQAKETSVEARLRGLRVSGDAEGDVSPQLGTPPVHPWLRTTKRAS